MTNILEGSVQKSNDQVRVNVQLINALTDAHLWADTYDRKLTDMFAVESEIAKTIAETLQARLTGSEKTAISKKPTENLKPTSFTSKAGSSGTNEPRTICANQSTISIKRSKRIRLCPGVCRSRAIVEAAPGVQWRRAERLFSPSRGGGEESARIG